MEGRPPTVAIVEDDQSMRRSIQRLLNAYDYAVEAFESAEAFLIRVPAGSIACLVVDVQLPGMSGIDLRSRLAAAGSALPVIFITGVDDDGLRHVAIKAGCVAFLRKPFAPDQLIEAVKNALSHSAPRC